MTADRVILGADDSLTVILSEEARAVQGAGVDQTAREAIAAEILKRTAGDGLQSIFVSTEAALGQALAAQADADTPLEIVFTDDVTVDGGMPTEEMFARYDVVFVSPRSNAIERRFNAVPQSVIDAEAKRRDGGDQMLTHENIDSEAALTSALEAHGNSNVASLLVISAGFTTSTRTYAAGQRWYLARHHVDESEFTLMSEAGSGGGADSVARANAAAAQSAAASNRTAIAALEAAEIGAVLEIDPPTVENAAGIQQEFTASLVNPRQDLLFDDHSGAPINRIRVTEENTGTVVHEEAWLYSGDDWVFQFEISAAEANAIGATGSSEDFELRVEFGRGAGNAFQALETTNWARVLIGERAEFPATRGELNAEKAARIAGDAALGTRIDNIPSTGGGAGEADSDIGGALDIGSQNQWHDYAISEDIEANRYYYFYMRIGAADEFMPSGTFKGADFLALDVNAGGAYAQGDDDLIGLVSPRPDADGVRTMKIARSGNARVMLVTSAQDHNIVRLTKIGGIKGDKGETGNLSGLPLFHTISPVPASVSAKKLPRVFHLVFSERQRAGVVTAVQLTVQGYNLAPHADTPVANIAGEAGALKFALTADRVQTISDNLAAGTDSVEFNLRLTFDDASIEHHRIPFVVNDPSSAPFDPNTVGGISEGDVTQIDNSRAAAFQGLSVWYGTKAQFDALAAKDANTIYFYPPA